jgi:hypothetical protein
MANARAACCSRIRPASCAVPIEQVSRIERVRPAQIEYLGGRRTMQYCGASLPVVSLHDAAAVGELTAEQQWVVIVFERLGRPLGLLAAEPLDMVEAALAIDAVTCGSAASPDRRCSRTAPSCCWTFSNWPTRCGRKGSNRRPW